MRLPLRPSRFINRAMVFSSLPKRGRQQRRCRRAIDCRRPPLVVEGGPPPSAAVDDRWWVPTTPGWTTGGHATPCAVEVKVEIVLAITGQMTPEQAADSVVSVFLTGAAPARENP